MRLGGLLLVGILACAGCKKQADAPPQTAGVPPMPATEVKRGQDACKAYVEKACACAETVAAMKQPCALSRALPEAIEVNLSVAANPESSRRDALQAQDSVRKIVKECIEEIAKLPSAGCP
ncbi:MAG TPA: hypothetical protein VLM79_36880 [Kofleriaceae bacterium]|nr:hypothetical protein [Kofleriaceae bacterium]